MVRMSGTGLPRIRVLVAALCLTYPGAAGCTDTARPSVSPNPAFRLDQPRLVQPDPGEFGAALPATRPGTPYTFGDVVVCLDRPGRVTVESAAVAGSSGGLRLDALAVRPASAGHGQIGGANRSLAQLGFARNADTMVDRVCPSPSPSGPGAGGLYELGLQFSRTGGRTATGHGVDVRYRTSGGTVLTLRIPFTLILCEGRDPAVPNCR
jgi:hypothetical protein